MNSLTFILAAVVMTTAVLSQIGSLAVAMSRKQTRHLIATQGALVSIAKQYVYDHCVNTWSGCALKEPSTTLAFLSLNHG